MLISNSCHQRWTLVDDEGTNLNSIPQGAFFELDIDEVTYYGISDFDEAYAGTTLVCRLFSDVERTIEVVSGTFTGLPYVIRFFGGWIFDFSDQGSFGRWVSNEVTIYQAGGKWVGRWVADIDTEGAVTYSFTGEFILLPLSVFGLTATPTPDAGGALAPGTYCYRVSAVDAGGNEGPASPVASATLGAQGDVVLTWNPTPGAANYKIYGRDCPCPSNLLDTIVAVPDDENDWEDDGGAGTPAIPPNDPDPDIEDDCPFVVIPNGDGTFTTLQDCDGDGCFEGTGPLGGAITICLGDPVDPPDGGDPGDDQGDDDGGVVTIPAGEDPDDGVIVIPIDPDGNPDDTVVVITEDEICTYRRIGPTIEPDPWVFTADEELKVFTLTNAVGATVFSTRPDFFEIEAYDDDSVDVRFHSTIAEPTDFAIAYNSYLTTTITGAQAEIDSPEDYVSREKTGRLNLHSFVTTVPGNSHTVDIRLAYWAGLAAKNLTKATLDITNGSYSMVALSHSVDEAYYLTAPGVPTGNAASVGTLTLTNGWSTTVIDLYVEAP